MDRLILGHSVAGEPIAECELALSEVGLLAGLAQEAARAGARRLWVHCAADLRAAGFTAQDGYRQFTGGPERDPAGGLAASDPLPVLDTATVAELLPQVFLGRWGHHRPDVAAATSGDAVYLGLRQDGAWIGLCRVEPGRRCVDGPGFLPGSWTPAGARQLVLAGRGYLGAGAVTVETWGEPAAPYLDSGLALAEETPGWERLLAGK
jgi:hypothetical protein